MTQTVFELRTVDYPEDVQILGVYTTERVALEAKHWFENHKAESDIPDDTELIVRVIVAHSHFLTPQQIAEHNAEQEEIGRAAW